MLRLLAAAGGATLMVLPGCWLAMRGPLTTLPLGARVSLALILSPAVVVAEFYVLRLAGVPFGMTTTILPLVNLPAAWLLWKALSSVVRPSGSTLLLWTASVALPAAYLMYWMGEPSARANWGHAWTHADIVYAIANGQLRPEEPYLAGLRLAYPWLLHVYHSVISYLLGRSPNDAYLWANFALFAGTIGLMAALVGELGGGRVARATSAVWMSFGINLAFVPWLVLPPDLMARLPRIWGDGRYSPWLRKFGLIAPSSIGIGLCVALLYAVARPSSGRTSWPTAGLCGLLVLTLGFFYPILLPAAVGIVAARVGASVIVPWVVGRLGRVGNPPGPDHRVREAARLVLFLAIALVGSAFFLRYVTVDRSPAAPVGFDTLYNMKLKAAAAILVLAPMGVGVLLAVRQALKLPVEWLTLLGSAVACVILNVIFHVYWDRNEYKFMLTAAVSLVPLAALGFATLPARWGRWGSVALVVLCLLFAAPGFYRRYSEIRAADSPPALVATDRFGLTLQPSERYAAILEAVRRDSPPTAVLLARRGDLDLSALTSRSMLVPADSGRVHGTGLESNHLLKNVRGYSGALVDQRRRQLFTVFDSGSTIGVRALDGLLRDLRRPVVVLLDTADTILAAWLPFRRDARLIFGEKELQAWLIGTSASGIQAGNR